MKQSVKNVDGRIQIDPIEARILVLVTGFFENFDLMRQFGTRGRLFGPGKLKNLRNFLKFLFDAPNRRQRAQNRRRRAPNRRRRAPNRRRRAQNRRRRAPNRRPLSFGTEKDALVAEQTLDVAGDVFLRRFGLCRSRLCRL